jgi:CRISPR-associated protein Csb2
MLALGIRYLNGFVAARTAPDDVEAEWPPHPARVFMALAAAHFQTGAEPLEREALLWLQSVERDGEPTAPCIIAPVAMQRAVVTHYVPINDKPGPSKAMLQSAPLTRDRQPRTFARAWLTDDVVYMIWPDAEPNEAVRGALETLCAKVTRIGHSSSLVQMWIARTGEVGTPNWVPDENRAVIRLRIAPSGTLEYLEHRFNGAAVERFAALRVIAEDDSNRKAQGDAKKGLKQEFADEPPPQLRPNLSIDRGYARPLPPDTNASAIGSVFSPHLVMLKLERQEGVYSQLDLACVLAVTQRWREALLSRSDGLAAPVRTVLSGHDADGAPLRDSHLAFVPLAFVGHEHADGHLLGMGIALPDSLSRDHRREILQAVGHVRELKLGRLGVWRIEPVIAARPPLNLCAEAWTAHPKGSMRWSTTTPIVFDQHPKAREKATYEAEVAAMVAQCCPRIGLPVPREVMVTPVSRHLGVPSARAFPLLRRKDGTARRHTHVILVFDKPVCGPMILGAGRYRGYGVCRPMHETDREAWP